MASKIIYSTIPVDCNAKLGFNFRSWKYITLKVRYLLDPTAEESDVLLDTSCSVTLEDRTYLLKQVPGLEIKKIISSIPIRGVGNKIIYLDEYAIVTIYINSIINGILRTACLIMEVYIVDNLKANILIGTDIMTS